MMRRAIVGVSAAAVMLALSLPWLLGLHAEHRYKDAVAGLSAAGYRIAQNTYRRDWLESKALLVIAPPMGDTTEPPLLQVVSRIGYGPGADGLLQWPPVLARARSRVTVIGGPRQLPPLLAQTALEAGGTLAATLRLPGITYSGRAGSLNLVDGYGELRLGHDGEEWRGRGELPLLDATDLAGRTLLLQGLGWQFDLQSVTTDIPLGEATLSLKALRLGATKDPPPLDIAGAHVHLRSAADASRARADAELRIDQLRLSGSAFAPSRLQLALTGIDAPSLTALLAGLREVGSRDLPESMRGLAIGTLLTQSLPVLLSATPRLELTSLELTTPFGAVTAKAHLTLPDGTGPRVGSNALPEAGSDLGQPLMWLQRLSGEAEASAPQALVLQLLVDEQRRRVQRELQHRGERTEPLPTRLEEELEAAAQASLSSLIRGHWLMPNRGRLYASAVLDGGLLILNGRPLPINGLAGS